MSEPTAEEREQQLVRLRRRMGRVLRRGESAEFDRLSAVYGRLKGEHVTRSHEEQWEEARARRAAVRAQEALQRPAWRLPRGFASPLAAERARTGWQERREPQHPGRGLSPWRSQSPMEQRVWRP